MRELAAIDRRFAIRGPRPPQPERGDRGPRIIGCRRASDFPAEELAASEALRLMTAQPFPWNRKVFALLLDRLFEAGARAVALDFLFLSEAEGDAELRAALERHRGKVVIGWTIEDQSAEQLAEGSGTKWECGFPAPRCCRARARNSPGSSFIFRTPDGVLRRVDYRTSQLREMDRDPLGDDLIGMAPMVVRQATGREPPAGFRRLINFQGASRTYRASAAGGCVLRSRLSRLEACSSSARCFATRSCSSARPRTPSTTR